MRARSLGSWALVSFLVGFLVAGSSAWAAKPQEAASKDEADKAQGDSSVSGKRKAKEATGADRSDAEQDSIVSSGYGLKSAAKSFLGDQEQIWTSPAKLRLSDADWLFPIAGISAGFFATDRDVSTHLSTNPSTLSHYKTISTAGVAALVGGAGGLWLLSYPAHKEHWRETGFLAGEAAINSLVAVETLKYSLRRERPYQGDGSGPFFSGGTSFPSEHAAAAWSVAGVIAHEYPGPLPKIAAYGLAALVSYSRIRARQHFNSDVFIGSMIGNMISQNVYTRHFDPSLGGGEWRSLSALARDWESGGPQNLGTPYVPLDSWVYPALDRLAGLGLIDSAFTGMRPWTRRECMRQLSEAEENLGDIAADNEPSRLVEALEREFHPDAEAKGDGTDGAGFRLESVYSRTEYISGMPLTDGFFLAQTQYNDFGRPYGQGWNSVNGLSAYVTEGPWVAYVRGELQTTPTIPALSLATREELQQSNAPTLGLPLQPGTPQLATSKFNLLDTYVGLMLSNWEVTFGRQSLWWGPGNGGPLDFSDNIQPINMFRVNRTIPLKLPSILGWLGPMRTEGFIGQLSGFNFVFSPLGLVGQWGVPVSPQPFIHGQRISFKPTRNFEFGFFRTTIYGGPGYPLTLHTLARSLFSTTNENRGGPTKPGNRTSAMDFSYRLPRLRDWVTFYGEAYTDDQFSPIAYMDRSAWQAGLYFSHIPLAPKLDLRVEGVYTDVPAGSPPPGQPGSRGPIGPGSFYANGTWSSGYTNDGNLIGNWVGRGGQGAQAWTNYWFNAKDRLQFNFRHQKVSQAYLPGGGTLTDAGVRGDYWVSPSWDISASVQYERWLFPIVQKNLSTDVSGRLEVMFQPPRLFRHSAALEAGNGEQP